LGSPSGSALDTLGPEGYGDVTRDIFFALRDGPQSDLRRTSSWHGQETEEPTRSSVAVPGGFRRHFVLSSGEAAVQQQEREDAASRSAPLQQGDVSDNIAAASVALPALGEAPSPPPVASSSQTTFHSLLSPRIDAQNEAGELAGPDEPKTSRNAQNLEKKSGPGGTSEAGSDDQAPPEVSQLLRGSPSSGLGLPTYGAVEAPTEAPRASQRSSGAAYAGSTTFVGELNRLHNSANDDGNDEDPTDFGYGLDPRLLPLRASGFCPRRAGGKSDLYTEPWQVVLVIVKSFTGSAVLYLPHALAAGGLGLAGACLLAVGATVILCVRKLVDCADTVVLSRSSDTYAELAEASLGPLGRLAVEISLLASQLGFAATYLVTIAANAREVVEVLSDCHLLLASQALLPLVTLLLAPLVFVRDLRSYDWMNITSGLALTVALLCITAAAAWKRVVNPSKEPILWANYEALSLSLGTAVYAFEGIGMVLPAYIGTSPKLRPYFKDLVTKTLSVLLAILIFFATSCYLAFGSRTQTIVLLQLPSGSDLKTSVQLLYSLALALTFPLALWPAYKILEARTFGAHGKGRTAGSWHFALRLFGVFLTVLLALPGPGRLGEFVALVGALACAPLAITFPALIHWGLGRRYAGLDTRGDLYLVVVGVLLTLVCLVTAALHWDEQPEVLPRFCTVAARDLGTSKGSSGDLFLFRSPLLLH